MAVVLRFTTQGLTEAKYNEINRRLNEAGAGSPAGRLYHVCFGDKENLRVSDIWDSKESFEKFGETLYPILQKLEVPEGQLEFLDVHNIIVGETAQSATR